jgi:hypothetical protein
MKDSILELRFTASLWAASSLGALFAVETALIFLLGVPASRWFLLANLIPST